MQISQLMSKVVYKYNKGNLFFCLETMQTFMVHEHRGVHKGCRTQHMPLADGTVCGVGMVSLHLFLRACIWQGH